MINTKTELENFLTQNWDRITAYLDEINDPRSKTVPFYTSVDIRESENKYAPVDSNLYPAGFNNICQLDLMVTSEKLKQAVLTVSPQAKSLAIIPESHSKNKFYLDHLATLTWGLKNAGFDVDLISPDPSLFEKEVVSSGDLIELESHSQGNLSIRYVEADQLQSLHDYDLIVLNNDQSKPLTVDWKQITTPIVPTPNLGWNNRQKAKHFVHYQRKVEEFCKHFEINPSLMQANFEVVEEIDFLEKSGLERIADAVTRIQAKTNGGPVYVKANQGTYGMGISVVNSPDEILELNRKKRNKMNAGKNNIKFDSVMVQEGIETVVQFEGHPAEVTIYLVGGKAIGGFLRTNPLKDKQGNLNSRGMTYQKYCMSEIVEGHDHKAKEAVYAVISRLASSALGEEIQEIKPGSGIH